MVLLFAALIHTPTVFCAQFTFTPRASVEGKYTDNLFLTDDDTDDDFVTTVSAGFALTMADRNQGLDFSFDPNYAYYQDFDEFNDWGLQSELRAWTNPTRATRLEVTNRFFRTTDPIGRQDRIASEGGRVQETGDVTVRRGREPYYRNRARFDGSYQFGRENRAYAGFSRPN
jgi:hypothetical protein